MNFSQLNFSNNFVTMQQFTAGAKIVGTIQNNASYIPPTSTPHYNTTINSSNHINFANNIQATTSMIQHHYQDTSPRNLSLALVPQAVNTTSRPTTGTVTQSHWVDCNETVKVSLPNASFKQQCKPIYSSQQIQTDNVRVNMDSPDTPYKQTSRPTLVTIEAPSRTVVMKSVATMTDNSDFVISKNTDKDANSEDCEDSSKPSVDSYFQDPNCSNPCSKVHLKSNTLAMKEYLNRLQPSSVPSEIKEFLQQHNIKINFNKTETCNEKNSDETEKGNPALGLQLSTALDGSLLYCCTECQMAYASKEQLDRHMLGHKEERKFECSDCGVCLKRKEHLDQHKRGHSEERPFVCEICCKGFKRNEHLRRHIVIHSGDKNYVCTQCGKAFSRKDHLTKHQQIHFGKRLKPESNDSTSPLFSIQTQTNIKESHNKFL